MEADAPKRVPLVPVGCHGIDSACFFSLFCEVPSDPSASTARVSEEGVYTTPLVVNMTLFCNLLQDHLFCVVCSIAEGDGGNHVPRGRGLCFRCHITGTVETIQSSAFWL